MAKSDSTGSYSYVCDGTSPGSPVLSDGHTVFTAGLSSTVAGVTSFRHEDALGSLRYLTDSGQNVLGSSVFEAFGAPVSATGSTAGARFGFVGGADCQTEADTGLVLMGHRYYDSRLGRFLSQDPAGDGDNWYSYAGNDPINGLDPTGLSLRWDDPGAVPYSDGSYHYPPGVLENGDTYSDDGHGNVVQHHTGPGITIPSGGGLFEGVGGAFGVGFAAVGSAASFHLWDGGAARHDPSFGVSRGLADIGVAAATAAFGGEGAVGEEGLAETGCFTAGTPVQTDDKPQAIETLRAGDIVATRNPATGQTEYRKVVRTFVHPAQETITVQFADAATGKVVETLTATPEHPFFVVGRGFVPLGSLGVGTSVVTRAGPALMVSSLVRQSHPQGVLVYNLEVEGDHTYFVGTAGGGVWVHNLCNEADIIDGGVVKGKILSFKQALERVRNGLDVFSSKRSEAKALAKAASGTNKFIKDPAHQAGAGYFEHFHPDPRTGSHIFFP